ncbi:hypothetical protein OOZ15_01900 [Galbibacter sp. EGI 63066]|uniref:hypothetical protein n=1 Tax=Galbibacter sp. EGI 63066 TaxID=2993559 RepID=UPI0022487BDB|nr:hypothetical protein [Galbibacter sp. EGI 63066]MCX2678683.1 hypothetical protein [Galbibacter sp. EGI 63066]
MVNSWLCMMVFPFPDNVIYGTVIVNTIGYNENDVNREMTRKNFFRVFSQYKDYSYFRKGEEGVC